METRKRKVTIDLEEYEELRVLKNNFQEAVKARFESYKGWYEKEIASRQKENHELTGELVDLRKKRNAYLAVIFLLVVSVIILMLK